METMPQPQWARNLTVRPHPQKGRTLHQLTPKERHRIDQARVDLLDDKLRDCIGSIERQTDNRTLIEAMERCRKILAAAVAEPPA
jgi:hypothetical protein